MAGRLLADAGSAEGAYLGIAAILTAAAGVIGSVVQLIRVLRAPRRDNQRGDEDA